MAVTRINNNQISDASAGNAYLGINAAVKLQNYSVTATKIANNLTYGSDLTITGNLTIQGNTTTVDTTYTTIEDPVILLASNQTGTPAVDIGFIGERGTSQNIAFVWDESASEFVTVYTNDAETNTTVSIASYASFHTKDANIGGNIVVNGTSSLVGNVLGNINGTGNINYNNGYFTGNVTVLGTFTSTSNIVANASGIFYGTAPTGNGAIYAGITGYTPLGSNVVAQFTGNSNSYSQINFQNISNLTSASTDFIATADNGNDSSYYLDLGINSSTFNDQVNYPGFGPNDSYVHNHGGNLILNPESSGKTIKFMVGGTANTNVVGNVSSTGLAITGTISANGNVTGGNVITGGIVTATGNIVTSANVNATSAFVNAGAVLASGRVEAGTTMSAAGNITGANIITGGLITATGNVTSSANVAGGNLIATTAVVTPSITGTTVTVSATGGAITLNPSSNVSVSSKNINNLADPVQNQDAATKIYVDNMVSTQIAYHQAVAAATTGTLEAATGGTITYTQPNGAGNGVGATLTVSGGSFTTIDTANIQTVGTRVLVKNQANTALNGVYSWANATALVRTTDADTYGPNSSTDLSINDYFFVQGGNVNAGSAWVVDGPSGTITFGTSNITFAQFSSSQTYSGGNGISFVGTVITAKVDNNTTAFDGNGNIIVKAGANLTTPNIGAATGTSLSVTGNLTTATGVSAGGNITGGNLLTAGLISSTGTITSSANITGGNLLTAGLISSTGTITSSANITGGNILTGGLISSTGTITSAANITGGNLLTSGIVSAASHIGSIVSVTANITGGNILTGGLISATGNITGGNINTTSVVGTAVSMSGNITGANINTGGPNGLILTGANINSNAGRITINQIDADVDFAVDGSGLSNVFYVDAGTRTASFGNSTQTTNAIVAFNATNSVLMPVGTTIQRPGTGVTGMLRFNTTNNGLEVFDNSQWNTVGTPTFTVISDDQFTGNGVATTFTLSSSTYTTNSVIVSINGVVQIPTSAYSVTGSSLTFTEAPQTGDLIDVRGIVTTTQVTSIANSPGNAVVAVNPTINEVSVTGNLVPVANNVQSLGSPTLRWKDLYVSGNTITMGNVVMKNVAGGNTIGFYGPDGTTPATIASTSVDTTTISNGTSSVSVVASNGNIQANVGGSTIGIIWSGGANITGVLAVSGNIVSTGSNGVANIGSATTYFNTVHAKATSAQYADLAENYAADAAYAPGTVLSFGGANEVTVSSVTGDRRIAGVVSTNPSYIMNAVLDAEHVATIALTGRVPTFVSGPVEKGDMMISAGNGRAIACATPAIGTVIGKALENHPGGDGVIEVVVGRL